jgi:hypothetical protein
MGYEYVVQAGDGWATVLRAFAEAGVKVSPEELMAANPDVVPQRLRVGEIIAFAPASAR